MENKVREVFRLYQQMNIGRNIVSCPYFMNVAKRSVVNMLKEVSISADDLDTFSRKWKDGKTDYGRFQGKGTPAEIVGAALEITRRIGLPIEDTKSPEMAVEVMKHIGLGVDCSGLVFNMLVSAFDEVGKKTAFINSLDWQEAGKTDVSRAGAFIFAGKASRIVTPDQLRSLDLILIKSSSGKYVHIALLLGDKGRFDVLQSSLVTIPTGINISNLVVKDGIPNFDFKTSLGKDWDDLYMSKNLEFRRLKIVDNIQTN